MLYHRYLLGLEIEGRALKTRVQAVNERCEQIIGSIMSICGIWVQDLIAIEGKEIPLYK